MTFWYGGDLFEENALSDTQLFPLDGAGLRFGATVFTTLRVYGENLHYPLTQWQGHCDRLTRSIQQFGWTSPHWPSVYQGCQQLKSRYPILRITLFPDGREWITGRALPPQLTAQQQTGVTCWVAPPDYARSLPAHKTGNYLACWLAQQQAQRHGARDAILTSAQGDWLETTTGNLWGWAKGQWWTPIGNQCLPGLMRTQLIQVLAAAGQSVSCQLWTPEQVMGFEAIAYSNCAVQLLPIHTILNGATTLEYNSQHASIKALQERLADLAANADSNAPGS